MRMWWLALVLAGCVSAPPSEAPPDEPEWAWAPDTAALGRMDSFTSTTVTTTGTAEPDLVRGPDGTLYVVNFANLYRREGNGWTQLDIPIEAHGDGSLTITPDGTLHMVATGIGDQRPRIPYIRSTDGGDTWTDPIELLGGDQQVDRPWITAHPDGRLLVFWNDYQNDRNGFTRSFDGGLTWSTPAAPPFPHYLVIGKPFVMHDKIAIPLNGFTAAALALEDGHNWTHHRHAVAADIFAVQGAASTTDTWVIVGSGTSSDRRVTLYDATDPSAWTEVAQPFGDQEAVWPWVVPGGDGQAVTAAYVYDPGPVPALSGTGIESGWRVSVATFDGAASQAWSSDIVRTGEICTRGSTCTQESWEFKDYFTAIALPGGQVGIAHDADAMNGIDIVYAVSS